jgi:hypothetical protein
MPSEERKAEAVAGLLAGRSCSGCYWRSCSGCYFSGRWVSGVWFRNLGFRSDEEEGEDKASVGPCDSWRPVVLPK